MLKSKIHRATVTDCDVDYVGSVTIDADLMRAADLLPNEQVHLWDIDNGARVVTYAIEGAPGSGTIQVNGAAARLVSEGHKVIVVSYGAYDDRELNAHSPIVVHVDDRNRMMHAKPPAEMPGSNLDGSVPVEEIPGVLGPGTAVGAGLS
jgi:aspartate 1-decarboxylase